MRERRKELKQASLSGEAAGGPKGVAEFLGDLPPSVRLKAVREPTWWPYVWYVPETRTYLLDVPGGRAFSCVGLAKMHAEIERRTGLKAPVNPWVRPGSARWAAVREGLRMNLGN